MDVMLISRIHVSDKSFLKIPGYLLYSVNPPDNTTAHDGSDILINVNLKHQELGSVSTKKIHNGVANLITQKARDYSNVYNVFSNINR